MADNELVGKPKRKTPLTRRPELMAISPQYILENGLKIEKDDARALYFLSYLLGARINEMTRLYVSRFKEFQVMVKVENVPTEKHSNKFETRPLVIPLAENALCLENEMWADVKGFLAKFDAFSTPFNRWKNMSEYLARNATITAEATIYHLDKGTTSSKIITKRFNPHFFRHCRATHLAVYYKFNEMTLCKFFGWTKADMAIRYVQANILEEALCRRTQALEAKL